ncbi:MAG: adenosine kinase [Bacteroidales bacterium]
MSRVLGIGNALVDIMTRLEDDNLLEDLQLPKGSMQLVDIERAKEIENASKHLKKSLASGGSAANTIRGLANLGVETSFIGKVGKDEMGDFFDTDLKKSNISPKLILSDNQTGSATALVSKDSERTFGTFLGAAVELGASDLSLEMFKGYDYLHIEGYLVQNHDLIEKALVLAKEAGLKVSLDLASYNVVEDNLDFLQKVVRDYVDIVFANEEESKAFTGKSPEESLDILADLCEIAVVKLGSKGSLIKKSAETCTAGVIPANAVDTTGAGDYYAGGFLYGLINNCTLEQCARIGAILSGNVIEVIGAQMEAERWTEIKKLVKEV